jgi:pilus assembly protein Flp/PilA
MTTILTMFRYHLAALADDEAGQTMAEYGILIAVIAVIVVLAATLLGGSISSLFNGTSGSL